MPQRIEDVLRPAGQASFAFQPEAAFQGQSAATGASGRSDLIGGHITGGDQSAQGQNPFNASAILGGFLDDLVKPFAKARAAEQYVKGFTDQMYKGAAAELVEDKNPLVRLFGSYAQDGAAAYAAQERVATVQQKWAEDQHELIKMSPSEVSKEFSQRVQNSLTGIGAADGIIGPALLQSAPSLLQATAKGAWIYNQQQAQLRAGSAMVAAGQAFNKSAQLYSTAGGEDQVGLQNATLSWLRSFDGVEGQTEESKAKTTKGSLLLLAEQGQGFAVTSAVKLGILKRLPDEDQMEVRDAVHRRSKLANATAVAENPAILKMYANFKKKEAYGELDGPGLINGMREINEQIAKATGFEDDYFAPDDYTKEIDKYMTQSAAASQRAEDRNFQEYLANARAKAEAEAEQTKVQVKAANALAAMRSPDPALMSQQLNVAAEDREAALTALWAANDWGHLGNAFKSGVGGTGVSSTVTSQITNQLASVVAGAGSEALRPLVEKFQSANAQNPALAKAYFGSHYPIMLNYTRLMQQPGMTPAVATSMAMDDSQYVPNATEIKSAEKAIAGWLSAREPGYFQGKAKLNKSSRAVWKNAISGQLAIDSKFATAEVTGPNQVAIAAQTVLANGTVEEYGPIAWRQRPGITPIWRTMGLPQDRASELIVDVISRALARQGYTTPVTDENAEFKITRVSGRDGNSIIITPIGPDGLSSHHANIPVSEFKREADQYKATVIGGANKTRPSATMRTMGLF